MIRFGVHGRGRQGHAVVCVVIVCAAFVVAYLFFHQSESVDVSHRSIFEDAKRVVLAKLYPRYSNEFATELPDPSQTREGNASTWIDMDAKSSDSEGLWKWDGDASDASVEPLHDWTPPIQEVESIRERDFSPVSPAVAENATSKTEIVTNKTEMVNATNDTHVRSAGLSVGVPLMDDFDSPIREVAASTVAPPASDAPASDMVAKSDTDSVKSSTVASSDMVASASVVNTVVSQEPIQSISIPPALLDMAPRYPVKDLTASLARDEIGTATAIGTTAVGANVAVADVAVKHTASFGSGVRESEKTAEPVSSASSPSVSSVPENQIIWRSADDGGTTLPLSTERDVGGASPTDETKKTSMGAAANRATIEKPASPWNVSEDPLPTNATRTENGVQFSSVKTEVNVYNSERTMERDTGMESAGRTETASNDSAVYRVCDGDTLESIAKRSGLASAELLYQWNQDRIADPELLPIGIELRLARP